MEETKPVKLNCDFCKKEIECPPDMLDAKKHACYECFQDDKKITEEGMKDIHVDAPREKMLEGMMMSMAKETFDKMWKKERDSIKNMPKHELAEFMFGSGAYVMFKQIAYLMKQARKQAEEEADKKNSKENEDKEGKEK